jgi:hypothetical protein
MITSPSITVRAPDNRFTTIRRTTRAAMFVIGLGLTGWVQAQSPGLPAGAVSPTQIQVQAIGQQLDQSRIARRQEAGTATTTTTEAPPPCRNGDMVRRPDGRMEIIKEDCGTGSRPRR